MIRACWLVAYVLVAVLVAATGAHAAGNTGAREGTACEAPDPRPSLKLDEAARSAAIAACRAALAADSSSATIRSTLAVHLLDAGEYDESLRLARESADLGDPRGQASSDTITPRD
jgi:hypothetical protein